MKSTRWVSFILSLAFCLGSVVLNSHAGTTMTNKTELKTKNTFVPNIRMPDLTVSIRRPPLTAYVGQKLLDLTVVAKNIGNGWKNSSTCVPIYLVLSKDTNIPIAWPDITGPFHEDRGLGAAICPCKKLAPGEILIINNFAANAELPITIPSDTPPGDYYLGAVFDPGKFIPESNETNNTYCTPIKILRLELEKRK